MRPWTIKISQRGLIERVAPRCRASRCAPRSKSGAVPSGHGARRGPRRLFPPSPRPASSRPEQHWPGPAGRAGRVRWSRDARAFRAELLNLHRLSRHVNAVMSMCSAWSSSQKPSVSTSTFTWLPAAPGNEQRHAHLSRMPLVELAGVLEFPERASQGPENGEERFWRLFPRAYHAQPTFPIARALDFRPPIVKNYD